MTKRAYFAVSLTFPLIAFKTAKLLAFFAKCGKLHHVAAYNDSYIGESEVFLDFQQRIADAAAVDRSVLVIGERGSGKEMAASRLHYLSKRWQKNLVTVNCAALAPTLIESELFGYEQGCNGNRSSGFEIC